MKLTVLTENHAGAGFLAEHGLSYFIEFQGKKILFDTGHTDVFLNNAWLLDINIQAEADMIVLSHGHWDHGDGLQYISDKTLITHPAVFMKRYRKMDDTPISLNLTREEIEERFKLVTAKEPYYISDDIIFLGEIPRLNNFEAQTTPFIDENNEPDFVPDDSAIVFIKNQELNIVTGCSHAGICNTINYARKVTGINTVNIVIGGFHLKKNNRQTQETIQFLKQLKIPNIYPTHCTELEALAVFVDELKIKQVKTGMQFRF